MMTMATATNDTKPKAADFASDQEVRWCPGCGDYAILKAIQKTLADLGVKRENTVFVSGIGCASRFPYYMSTYGFHTSHGRAPAFATGIKLANPELDVWVVSGDGDGLSIGGNHTLHVLRRNVNVQICLFNNEIYGLTKGQYSPTSRQGTTSPSSPRGSLERPLSACAFALGAGARFVGLRLRARRRGTLRRPLGGYAAETPGRSPEARSRAPRRLVHRDLPELYRLQRRRLLRLHRQEPGHGPAGPCRARKATHLR
jgi:hypothetical protein